ncbi:hypothetical protein [Streptomyces chattanoogensis]|uniref:Lipoprotein n=1 Tax=Streptomyces chattanoogensis TaxID=66876 RepID=A0A0N0H1V7_9ACTN|nr:hypothetical protein [Streptomyces chattanoogensis]KPC64842.1 hypothetical protein ADL29_09430 [Streptomyces chattanoogensis]
MKASRIVRRRLAGAATVAALAVAGTLAAAPTASAKANLLAIDKVSLAKSGPELNIKYSCDTGVNLQVTGYATKVTGGKKSAAGALDAAKLTCDFGTRAVQMKLTPAGKGFVKGDKVKVTVFYWDENGSFSTQSEEVIATL